MKRADHSMNGTERPSAPQTVSPDAFIRRMTDRWQTTLQNAVRPELQAVWSKLCSTLNNKIEKYGTVEGRKWSAFPGEMGVAKTEGLKLYCAMLTEDNNGTTDQPGVLIIVRLKSQAEDIQEDIDRLAGNRDVALAYHGGKYDATARIKVKREELQNYPVLIITHAAYENGLDALSNDTVEAKARWQHLHAWNGEARRLTVIDEALDLVREERATLKNLNGLRGVIPLALKLKHPEASAAIDDAYAIMEAIAAQKKTGKHQSRPVTLPEPLDFTPFWNDLKENKSWPDTIRFGDPTVPSSVIKAKSRFLRELKQTLSGLARLLRDWAWYTKARKEHLITTAWFLVPDEGINGAVCLDATAEVNIIYKLFPELFEIVQVPKARSYRNVRLIYTYGEHTGRDRVVEDAEAIVKEMVVNVQELYCGAAALRRGNVIPLQNLSVLFVTHQAVEPAVMAWTKNAGFGKVDVGHWNALDGRNDWSEYTTEVILSQPHRDPITPLNIFQVVAGPLGVDALNSSEPRKWQEWENITQAIETSYFVVENTQAMGRIRMRRTVDAHGNCHPVDVIIRLPKKHGPGLLAGLETALPGIQLIPWESYVRTERMGRNDGMKRLSALKPSFDEALVIYSRNLDAGWHLATKVREEVGCSPRRWAELAEQIKDNNTPLSKRLAALHVSYTVERQRSRQIAYLVKQSQNVNANATEPSIPSAS